MRRPPIVTFVTVLCLFVLSSCALARDKTINFWPIFKYEKGAAEVLSPIFKYDNNNGDFAARPLIEVGGKYKHVAFAVLHFVFPGSGDHTFYRLANLWYGRDGAPGHGPVSRHIGFFPLFWGTRDGQISYCVLFPLFWRFDDSLAFFPLYGHGKTGCATAPERNDEPTSGAAERTTLAGAQAATSCAAQPATSCATQPATTTLEWRFVLWPLFAQSKSDEESCVSVLWPIFNRVSGQRESGWRVFPLMSQQREAISTRGKADAVDGGYESTLIYPLLCYSIHTKGTVSHEAAGGKIEQGRPNTFESSQRLFLLLLTVGWGNEKTPSGEIVQDGAAFSLFPLYSTFRVSKDHSSRHDVLLFLLNASNSDIKSHWSALGGFLTGYHDRQTGAGHFRVLWRLYEYSKDEKGQKRLRLFFSPAFKIGEPSANQTSAK